jgi:hypothetical protein
MSLQSGPSLLGASVLASIRNPLRDLQSQLKHGTGDDRGAHRMDALCLESLVKRGKQPGIGPLQVEFSQQSTISSHSRLGHSRPPMKP